MHKKHRIFSYKSRPGIMSLEENPLYETLKPIYNESPQIESFAFYNDQLPPHHREKRRDKTPKAHSKGAVAFDDSTGFWMVSSVPRFPANVSNDFQYLINQTKYGQMVFCVTINRSVKPIIRNVFRTTDPLIYISRNFTPLEEEPLNSTITDFHTLGGKSLRVFAKSGNFGEKDIYEDLISPGFSNASLFVLTWTYTLNETSLVKKVRSVGFSNGLKFNSRSDHSKWAVAEHLPWTCIGDINRKESQFKRGGLSLCLKDESVAKEFRKLYSRTENQLPLRGVCRN